MPGWGKSRDKAFYPIQRLTHHIAFTPKILQNPRVAIASEHYAYVLNLNISAV